MAELVTESPRPMLWVVGDPVSADAETALKQIGDVITEGELEALGDGGEDVACVVIQVRPDAADLAGARRALDWAEEKGKPVVLGTVDGTWTTETLSLLNHPAAPAHRLVNDNRGPFGAEVQRVLRTNAPPDHPAPDQRIELGAGVTLPTSKEQYEALRLASIRQGDGARMEEFRRDLDHAKWAIRQAELPNGGVLPWVTEGSRASKPPPETPSLRTPAQKPSLSTVYQFHDSPSVAKLLHPELEPDSVVAREWTKPETVLIRGETGTGKTELANQLARELGRPLVQIELEGESPQNAHYIMHGAAPFAWNNNPNATVGKLAEAAYGVAFIDELGDLQPEWQAILLTFFNNGLIQPTHINQFKSFATVIAATDANLEEMISKGQFRKQLRARFRWVVRIPALHERSKEDRKRLIHFAAINPEINRDNEGRLLVTEITPAAMQKLAEHEYRSRNFRELEDVVKAAVLNAVDAGRSYIDAEDWGDFETPIHARALVYRADPPPDGHVRTFSGDEAGFHRIAIESDSAIQQTSDGALYLVDKQGILSWRPAHTREVDDPVAARGPAEPKQIGLLCAVPDVLGRFVLANADGFRAARDTQEANHDLPIGSTLDGNFLAAITPNGVVHCFPKSRVTSSPPTVAGVGLECLAVSADRSLLARAGSELVRFHARTTRDGSVKWDSKPDYVYEGTDVSRAARAYLVPTASGDEELLLVDIEGALNPAAEAFLAPLAETAGLPELKQVAALDLLQRRDQLWIAVALPAEPDPRKAVMVVRFARGKVAMIASPFAGERQRVRLTDRLTGLAWVRGDSSDPLLVLGLENDGVSTRLLPSGVKDRRP